MDISGLDSRLQSFLEWQIFYYNLCLLTGCEGSFYGHFGEFNVTDQWDWEELYCRWTIHNPGLSDPVLYIAAHDVQLISCE